MTVRSCGLWCIAVAISVLLPALAVAEESNEEQLAKNLANPIGNLISVPLQFNYDSGYGSQDGKKAVVNFQPVLPISISEDWNLISRTVLPLVWQDNVVAGTEQTGLGDATQSLFFSPKVPEENGLIWGFGPVALFPTATESELGTGKWGLGPTGILLRQSGPWTYGLLANHIWSFAGESNRNDVNSTFLQPFVVYTMKTATSIYLNTETTYDWRTNQASVPINAGVNQMLKIGGQPIQIGAGLRYWAASSTNGPEDIGARVNLVFLFPK